MHPFVVWRFVNGLPVNVGFLRAQSVSDANAVACAMYGTDVAVVEWRYSSDAARVEAIKRNQQADADEVAAIS